MLNPEFGVVDVSRMSAICVLSFFFFATSWLTLSVEVLAPPVIFFFPPKIQDMPARFAFRDFF